MESVPSVLGYYNILAHVIPGMLYLYVLNEVSRTGDLPYLKPELLNNANTPPAILAFEIIAILLAAFVISHMLEPIAARILYLAVGQQLRKQSLDRLKQIHTDLRIDFAFHDIDILHTVIQQRSQEVSRSIEQYQALSVMFRNLAVGFFLLGVLEFTKLALNGIWAHAVFGILALLLSIVAFSRSNTNRLWSYTIIYEAALEYGSNLKEVIENSPYRVNQPKQKRTKTNSTDK